MPKVNILERNYERYGLLVQLLGIFLFGEQTLNFVKFHQGFNRVKVLISKCVISSLSVPNNGSSKLKKLSCISFCTNCNLSVSSSLECDFFQLLRILLAYG